MTLNMENDDVREYIAQITLAERYATQIEAIKRLTLTAQYDSDVRNAVECILGIKKGEQNEKA